MGITYSDLQIQKNTSGWTTVGGWHVTCLFPTLGTVLGQDQPPSPLYLFEADNNANMKYISRQMPADGQNPNVSTMWESWMQVADSMQDYICMVISNQQNLDITSVTMRGYLLFYAPQSSYIRIFRHDGGAIVLLGTVAIVPDVFLHRIRWTREVSGANRYHRIYFDDMTNPVLGPINDATYSNFSWWGFYQVNRPRIICGGESCRS